MRFDFDNVQDVVILTVRRELGDEAVSLVAVKSEVARRVNDGERQFLVDVSEMDFVDSSSMGALAGTLRLVEQNEGVLMVCGVGLRFAETLHVAEIQKALPIRKTRDEALKTILTGPRGPGALEAYLPGNPSLEAIRNWWEEVRPPRQETATGTREESSIDVVGDPQEGNIDLHLRDWLEALRVFNTAKSLAQRYELQFSADVSFKHFLSTLADKLSKTE
jgi:anti-anti-sigma factor